MPVLAFYTHYIELCEVNLKRFQYYVFYVLKYLHELVTSAIFVTLHIR
jgi:hypothetical protein